jgi:hypothetical protein
MLLAAELHAAFALLPPPLPKRALFDVCRSHDGATPFSMAFRDAGGVAPRPAICSAAAAEDAASSYDRCFSSPVVMSRDFISRPPCRYFSLPPRCHGASSSSPFSRLRRQLIFHIAADIAARHCFFYFIAALSAVSCLQLLLLLPPPPCWRFSYAAASYASAGADITAIVAADDAVVYMLSILPCQRRFAAADSCHAAMLLVAIIAPLSASFTLIFVSAADRFRTPNMIGASRLRHILPADG